MTNLPHGLKDHEIAALVNNTTAYLQGKLLDTPQCLRELISTVITQTLESQHLRIDAQPTQSATETDTKILEGLINLFRDEDAKGRFQLILDYDNYQDGARIFDGDGNLLGECYNLFDEIPWVSDPDRTVILQFKAAIMRAMQKQNEG